jgi:hypothetical protein
MQDRYTFILILKIIIPHHGHYHHRGHYHHGHGHHHIIRRAIFFITSTFTVYHPYPLSDYHHLYRTNSHIRSLIHILNSANITIIFITPTVSFDHSYTLISAIIIKYSSPLLVVVQSSYVNSKRYEASSVGKTSSLCVVFSRILYTIQRRLLQTYLYLLFWQQSSV